MTYQDREITRLKNRLMEIEETAEDALKLVDKCIIGEQKMCGKVSAKLINIKITAEVSRM